MPLAFSFLGIQNSQMFAAKNIFARAGEIIDRVFLFGNDVSTYYQENGLQISPDRSVDVNSITNSNGEQSSDGIEYKL
jgi:hypothetical protein